MAVGPPGWLDVVGRSAQCSARDAAHPTCSRQLATCAALPYPARAHPVAGSGAVASRRALGNVESRARSHHFSPPPRNALPRRGQTIRRARAPAGAARRAGRQTLAIARNYPGSPRCMSNLGLPPRISLSRRRVAAARQVTSRGRAPVGPHLLVAVAPPAI